MMTMKDIDEIRRDNLRIIERERGGPSEAAKVIGMSPAQFANLRDGAKNSKTGKPRGMHKATARKIEEKCGKPSMWLDMSHEDGAQQLEPAPTPPPKGAVFYLLDAEAACGDGRQNGDYPEIVRAIVLSDAEARERIGSINKSGSIQVIVATGDSMVPTIQPRDLLFVDTAVTEFSGDGIYLIRRDHGLSCKRLSMAGRTLLVTSDNPVARDWKWKDKRESDAIIGRVMAALPMTFKQFY
jgi:phage repressor protein C with HTH and peptisase S24 domain